MKQDDDFGTTGFGSTGFSNTSNTGFGGGDEYSATGFRGGSDAAGFGNSGFGSGVPQIDGSRNRWERDWSATNLISVTPNLIWMQPPAITKWTVHDSMDGTCSDQQAFLPRHSLVSIIIDGLN
uniref:Uncharacterized protein n=1 Tax=Ditylenchus dipsaci TaxID=166011 RepID=A0A915EKK5_9BILA